MTESLLRTFSFGALTLEDPAPDLAPLEALKMYQDSYPELAHAEIGEGEFIENKLVFKVLPLKAGTKG
jgi:PRTRC genetic system protein C|tara:strand:+ start:65357 stop:65560 length:204 start_codon:yes stop_codon:yes gene_type:complete